MKYTIFDYSQAMASKFNLTIEDLALLDYMVKFSHLPRIKRKTIKGKECFWISYDNILKDIPILKKGKKALRAYNLKRLCDAKILELHLINNLENRKGNYTFYSFSENFEKLINGEDMEISHPQKRACKNEEKEEQKGSNFFDKSHPQKEATLTHKSSTPLPTKVADKELYSKDNRLLKEKREYTPAGGRERELVRSMDEWNPIQEIIPTLKIDKIPNSNVDINGLLNVISSNKFLKLNLSHTSKINNLYDKIMTGYYDAFKQPDKDDTEPTHPQTQRKYTQQELDTLFPDLENYNDLGGTT